MGSARHSDENMDDDDDKDDTKRKSRNLSEKKRRDQFNMLVNELGKMVTTNTRKMDKSTVLKSTILFLKNHNEIAVKSRVHEIQEDWKPSFLSNEEFTHLILEALDGFIMVFSSNGRIYYASESVTSLLGYLPSELANATIYEITYQDDQSHLYNVLLNTGNNRDQRGIKEENKVSFTCHMKRGGLDFREEITYELVQFNGYFRSDAEIETFMPNNRIGNNMTNDTKLVFVGTGRLQTPQLIRDMSFVESSKSEFTSRHSLEWKFLFLDHRAPPIIGYLPFEVLGTSGYDYYHVDDLEKVVTCHESLMLKGEGTSCHYRFLTKGQQWIWLQTRFYIECSQWTSKPEFIVCTHTVVSYTDVIKHRKNGVNDHDSRTSQSPDVDQTSSRLQLPAALCQVRSSAWSPKPSKSPRPALSRGHYHGGESDTNSISPGSQSSRQSVSTTHSSKPKATPANPTKSRHQPETSAKLCRQPEIDQSCANYVEPQRFVAEPLASVVPTFIAPAAPAVPISLTNSTVLLNQQNIVMTTAQNQIQAELQRKHEELQQLIVHQQEELRRVSEQLLIARYGILSPLINVGIPYNGNACQQVARCCTTPNGAVTNPSATTDSIPGINDLQVSIALPVPIVSMEPFPHAATVITVDEDGVPIMQQQQHHHHHPHQRQHHQQQQHQQQQHQQQEHQQQQQQQQQQHQHHPHQQQHHQQQQHQQQQHQHQQHQQQQQQQHQHQRQQQQRQHHHQHHHHHHHHQQQQQQQQQHQQLQRQGQHQHPHHQLQMSNQENHATQMMPYQTCPSNDMIYGNVDTASSAQQRENRN